MPTPVSSARQCLAGEAAAALDDAVAVARRRSHAQTTSLHVVYALLSSPSPSASGGGSSPPPSLLRDALSRARSSAYSPRLQCKALELCFGVALDRLPSSSSSSSSSHHHHSSGAAAGDEPPVSNSLMAAIKRSQANQRRNPDTFHLYQHHQSSSVSASSFSGVKVELQQLILAILDDPVVSRVFGEAGFRSGDIKLAVLRPPPPILRFPRGAARCPPLFLCNFSAGGDFEPPPPITPKGFAFPFAAAGQLGSDGGDENCRRIGEVLARRSGRNPLLVGVGAGEAARDFARAIERQNWAVLPAELRGLRLITLESGVSELRDRSGIGARLEEVGLMATEPGVVLSIGDLKGMAEGSGAGDELESCLVLELTRVLELHRGRLWVMGWSATYETYMKFLSRYPLLDKDWDLQLLPITSVRPVMGGSLNRPPSFMESFVPFGGLFPSIHESKNMLSSPCELVPRCPLCNDMYEQEIAAVLKGQLTSVEDQHQTTLPSWLCKTNMVNTKNGLDTAKAKDDKSVLNVKISDVQKKWTDYCQRLHQGCQRLETKTYQVLPNIDGLPYVSDGERANNQNSKNPDSTQSQRGSGKSFPVAVGLPKITTANQSVSLPLVSEPKNKDLLSKLQVRHSKSEPLLREGFQSHQGDGSDLGNHDDRASPPSVTSVTTDLILGTLHEHPSREEKPAAETNQKYLQDRSGCLPSKKVEEFCRNTPEVLARSYSCSVSPDSRVNSKYSLLQTPSAPKAVSTVMPTFDQPCISSSNMCQKFDQSNYKLFYANLSEKVGRQEEALSALCQAIVRCRTGHERRRGARLKGDIWLSFLGPDRIAKKKVAVALAELFCGGKENLVCIDLSHQEGFSRPNLICDQVDTNGYDARFRGRTNIDHIAEEVSKKPWSLVFLENVDRADPLVQNSLSRAIQTGKFPDSYGREFSINNAIFVLTARMHRGKDSSPRKDCTTFPEERILAAQGWRMKIVIEPISEAVSCIPNLNVSVASRPKSRNKQGSSSLVYLSKRKFGASDDCCEPLAAVKRAHRTSNTFLDLNLPVEEIKANDLDSTTSNENNSMSDNTEAWLEDTFDLVDEIVNFKTFDFDALADDVLKGINRCFCDTIGPECTMEIDMKVMEQILAAAWILEDRGALNIWLERVLRRSFTELRQRHNLSAHSVLRLVACEGAIMEEHAPGILLPSRIIVS